MENIYNWDEKGFLIGLAHALKRIMTQEAYDQFRIRAAKQDGSWEFISLLATICADGTKVPPALIYQGVSRDLQDSWVDELTDKDEAFFASLKNGWSNNEFGLNYLKDIFDPYTRAKAGRGRMLLIVDGHSSHVNIAFIDMCDRLRILVMILPPHSTHRLQPLDVGLFQPLATAYSNELNSLMHKGESFVIMTKRMFQPMFKRAQEASFIPKNIESAWRKTRIWPFQPSVILNTIKRRPCTFTNTKTDRDDLKTPTTTKAVRKFQKAYWDDPSKAKLKKLFRANETLAARTSIAEHRARNLQEALQIEKKKRQRGKRLNLCGKETSGAQWYGVPEVQEARAYAAAQTAKEEQEKLDKENKKIEAEIKRQVKEADKKAKALQRDIARQATQAKKAEAAAAKAAKKKPTKARKNGRKLGIVVLKPKEAALRSLQVKSGVQALVSVVQEVGVQITTKSGRQVQLALRAKLREM